MKSGRNIFIIHPSPLLTDHQAHGDGLLAYRFICELAARGNRLSVACEAVELSGPLPANIKLFPIRLLTRRFGLVQRVEYAWRVRRVFERLNRLDRFDLAHQLNPVFAGLSLGFVGSRVPLVLGPYVAHWPFARSSRLKSGLLDAIGRFQQNYADAILISGAAAGGRILGRRVRAHNTFTVPYGIDLTMFPQAPPPVGDPVILYLAGLSARKGILVLLEAFDLVAARLPNVRLVVGGDGPERSVAQARAARSPFRDRIEIIGAVARRDVPATLAACAVFCLSSYSEPYGMSLIEAMATGRPVVATAAGGPVDVVDPRGGVLVPPGDAAALANGLLTVLRDPAVAQRMGEFNRQAMLAFGWPAVVDRLEAVYDAVTATPASADDEREVAAKAG